VGRELGIAAGEGRGEATRRLAGGPCAAARSLAKLGLGRRRRLERLSERHSPTPTDTSSPTDDAFSPSNRAPSPSSRGPTQQATAPHQHQAKESQVLRLQPCCRSPSACARSPGRRPRLRRRRAASSRSRLADSASWTLTRRSGSRLSARSSTTGKFRARRRTSSSSGSLVACAPSGSGLSSLTPPTLTFCLPFASAESIIEQLKHQAGHSLKTRRKGIDLQTRYFEEALQRSDKQLMTAVRLGFPEQQVRPV